MTIKQVLTLFCVFLISWLTSNCRIPDPTQLNQETTDTSVLSLATADEPGERLHVYGIVVDRRTEKPIPYAEIYIYHADANGQYLPADPEDESTSKLSGKVVAGPRGQFTLRTILPGEYDQPGNRHFHLHYVRATGYEDFGGVVLFENNVNDEVRQWANETGFGIIIEAAKVGGTTRGNLVIPLDPITE